MMTEEKSIDLLWIFIWFYSDRMDIDYCNTACNNTKYLLMVHRIRKKKERN